jgi:(1->4)-alpha-D-glucan 1-alpha-D-glucosylmutase
MPGTWKRALAQWSRLNRRFRTSVEGQLAPDRTEEYLLYQTLVGAWPLEALDGGIDESFVDRISAYMIKALREAKRNTSWLNPSQAYEDAVTAFVRRALDASGNPAFFAELVPLLDRVAHAGIWNSLAQTAIKIGAPGVPDFYQGTEIWDFSLVDPDNRRPVDYGKRLAMLDQLTAGGPHGLLSGEALRDLVAARLDGRIKLYTTLHGLRARHERPGVFRAGEYMSLEPGGAHGPHVFAFARVHESAAAVVVVPRLTTKLVPDAMTPPLADVWRDTFVPWPAGFERVTFRNVFTAEHFTAAGPQGGFAVADLLRSFPVAVLVTAQGPVGA